MTYRPDFAAYFFADWRAGAMPKDILPGDLIVRHDGATSIYRDVEARWHGAFFDWASSVWSRNDEQTRLAGSVADGFDVESYTMSDIYDGAPEEDSDEYQDWLDHTYSPHIAAWQTEHRPAAHD